MTLGERIRKVRRHMDLTQYDFGKRIGIKSNSVSLIESGGRNASEQVILAICREFEVSEEWLRTETGDMFIPKANDALDALAQERGISRSERILIEKFLDLKPENRKAVMDYVLEVAAAVSAAAPSGDMTVNTVESSAGALDTGAANIDIEAEVARYRAELERQKKAADGSSALFGSKSTKEKMA